jgi:trk system potassium uptake protein TrkH
LTAAERRPRGRPPYPAGIDVGGALHLVGSLLKYLGLSAILPTAVALGYSEPAWPFPVAGAIAVAFGWGLERLTQRRERAGLREGFLVVSLTWLLAAAYAALPYVLASEGALGNPLNAYFEAMSGFTTTGATVVSDPGELTRSLLMWRQFTQWLGGMGIIVLALAVLPRLRVGGRQLLEHELPGPEIAGLATSIRSTAQRLWLLYIGLTALLASILIVFGWTGVDEHMSPYKAIAHAFTTMPTGGFGTDSTSLQAFGPASQWVITVFMVLAGANFALLYRTIVHGRLRAAARDEELRLYLLFLALGSAVIFAVLLDQSVFRGTAALRHAAFNAVSMMTTTGYASADYTRWTALTAMTIVGLMFVGGSAGSTGGAVKVVRYLLIAKVLRRELDQTVHPEAVHPIRLNHSAVDERTVRGVITFVLLYVGVFVLGAAGLAIESARFDAGLSPFEAMSAAATTLGNVGPAFGFAGPFGSYEPFSALSKVIMIVLMWLGRLEIVPIVLLFTRGYWRR